MQVEHDARAGGPRGGERAPAERRLHVVGVDDPRAGAPHGGRDVLRRQPAAHQAEGGAARAERRGVALEHLGLLAELGPDQPREILHRLLLAAGRAVPVVQEQDHRGEPRWAASPAGRLTSPAPWHPPPRSSSRRAAGATTSRSRSRPCRARPPRTARRSSSWRTTAPTSRPSSSPSRTARATSPSARGAASTSPATRRWRPPRATCCASSTTTSRPGRSGSARCSPRPPRTPDTRRSAGRSARGSRGPTCTRAGASRRR